MDTKNMMEKLVSLCKRRGFILPGSEIYGGLANSWDYGPLGAELKNNIKNLWWKKFVQQRGDMFGIDAALMMNNKVWQASGHVGNFNDPLVECKRCHTRYRADQFPFDPKDPNFTEKWLSAYQSLNGFGDKNDLNKAEKAHKQSLQNGITLCPKCEEFAGYTAPRDFNMMFETHIGPVKDDESKVYLRPETAQAMFVDFPAVLETSRARLPFGIAQIGKAFRNEITPGNFIFRTREFEQLEIEYFVRESEWEKYFGLWLDQMKSWMLDVGIDPQKVHYHEIAAGDRAHYSKRTIDIEFDYPFGQKELYGLAYRADFDLASHQKSSGKDLTYRDPETGERILPHVIEPSMGLDRTVLAVLLSAYSEIEGGRSTTTAAIKDTEVVLRLPKAIAPVKIALLPLSKKEQLSGPAKNLADQLRKYWSCQYDETGSIGKRYRRQDEIGTPFCVTLDFESLADKKVTVRDRDSMAQERVASDDLISYFKQKLES